MVRLEVGGRDARSVVAVLLFHRPTRRIRDGQKTRKGVPVFSFTHHPRPHRRIAAGDAAKCDAAPFLGRAARGRRAMRLSSARRWGTGGPRKSDVGQRSRIRDGVEVRRRRTSQQRPSRSRSALRANRQIYVGPYIYARQKRILAYGINSRDC